jgi:hypothetical protein
VDGGGTRGFKVLLAPWEPSGQVDPNGPLKMVLWADYLGIETQYREELASIVG